jgi:hypothetical protein
MRQKGKSFREIGEHFNVSATTARRWVQGEGKIPAPSHPAVVSVAGRATPIEEDDDLPDWISVAFLWGALCVAVIVVVFAIIYCVRGWHS